MLGGHHAPASQHDLWLWINGGTPDVVFEHARAATQTLAPSFVVASDRTGFVHRDSRDLTGFIDGTANPILLEAPEAALVPDGSRGAGGSHVLTMRWVHDLDAFDRLSQDQQENVFGRTKPDSIEFVGARLPTNAHIARVQIDDDAGEEVQIYRRSVPYGTTLVLICSTRWCHPGAARCRYPQPSRGRRLLWKSAAARRAADLFDHYALDDLVAAGATPAAATRLIDSAILTWRGASPGSLRRGVRCN